MTSIHGFYSFLWAASIHDSNSRPKNFNRILVSVSPPFSLLRELFPEKVSLQSIWLKLFGCVLFKFKPLLAKNSHWKLFHAFHQTHYRETLYPTIVCRPHYYIVSLFPPFHQSPRSVSQNPPNYSFFARSKVPLFPPKFWWHWILSVRRWCYQFGPNYSASEHHAFRKARYLS